MYNINQKTITDLVLFGYKSQENIHEIQNSWISCILNWVQGHLRRAF